MSVKGKISIEFQNKRFLDFLEEFYYSFWIIVVEKSNNNEKRRESLVSGTAVVTKLVENCS